MTVNVVVNTRELDARIQKLQNPAPLMSSIGSYLVAEAQKRIRSTKVSPDGVPWAPWSASTYFARAKQGTVGRGLLFNNGTLLNSLGFQVGGKRVTVQDSAPYAGFLQYGTPRMPARPFLGIGEQDKVTVGQIVSAYLSQQP